MIKVIKHEKFIYGEYAMESKINIPKILETNIGSTKKISCILKQYHFQHVACLMGKGLRDMFGRDITDGFENDEDIELVINEEYEELNVCSLIVKAYNLPKNIDCIIGIGGGKAIDSAKYLAFLLKLPFISVPTSISNDGFSSSMCSLYVDNKRTSVQATMPFGIIADIGILKSAPERFYFSGIGDIVSKITAVYDWEREDSIKNGTLNHFAALISKKSVNSVVRLPFSYIREDMFIEEVIDSLIMSGIAMEIAGNSAPASGSEHQISHALDLILEKPCLHGIQVGIATYIMSIVQDHREKRVYEFLRAVGFFEHAKSCKLQKSDYIEAIKLAPQIKPNRNTYINDEKHRNKAIDVVKNDELINEILV